MPTIDERRIRARRHVEFGRLLIARQQHYLKELKDSGRDTEAAERLLLVLERRKKSSSTTWPTSKSGDERTGDQTASLSSLDARKATFLPALISSGSPVLGLRTMRAA